VKIPESDYQIATTRSSGPGGQHANKVETAVQLRFDIRASSLDPAIQDLLLTLNDSRITKDGVLLLKSSRYRSQSKNKEDVVDRLHIFIQKATKKRKKRKPTKPSMASVKERLEVKTKRGKTKELRKKVIPPQES
jgi:ribosome-associated protein